MDGRVGVKTEIVKGPGNVTRGSYTSRVNTKFTKDPVRNGNVYDDGNQTL